MEKETYMITYAAHGPLESRMAVSANSLVEAIVKAECLREKHGCAHGSSVIIQIVPPIAD